MIDLDSKEDVLELRLTPRELLFVSNCFALAGYYGNGCADMCAQIDRALQVQFDLMGGQDAYRVLNLKISRLNQEVRTTLIDTDIKERDRTLYREHDARQAEKLNGSAPLAMQRSSVEETP
jgi:hypothetical protein